VFDIVIGVLVTMSSLSSEDVLIFEVVCLHFRNFMYYSDSIQQESSAARFMTHQALQLL
jgi:hypothetical protein